MPRYKSKTSQKRQSKQKNQKINNVMSQVKKIEKEWQQTPYKLITLLEKQIKAHKKQEVKMEKAVNKLAKLMYQSESRLAKAIASKNPRLAKKKVKSIQKELKGQTKLYTQLRRELENLTLSIQNVSQKHDRLIMLDKYISNFESEWNASSKTTKKNKKSKLKNIKENDSSESNLPNEAETFITEEVMLEAV